MFMARPDAAVSMALELIADFPDPAEKIARWGLYRAIVEGRPRQAHQLASPADRDIMGPVTTEAPAPLGRGANFNAPFNSLISSAGQPDHPFEGRDLCFILADPDPDQLSGDIVLLRPAVHRLSGQELIGDLPLERAAVETMPGHDFHLLEARSEGQTNSLILSTTRGAVQNLESFARCFTALLGGDEDWLWDAAKRNRPAGRPDLGL